MHITTVIPGVSTPHAETLQTFSCSGSCLILSVSWTWDLERISWANVKSLRVGVYLYKTYWYRKEVGILNAFLFMYVLCNYMNYMCMSARRVGLHPLFWGDSQIQKKKTFWFHSGLWDLKIGSGRCNLALTSSDLLLQENAVKSKWC